MSKIVFRFKVVFEDVDDVERTIDVNGTNSFSDFHLAIQDAIQFDRIKPASFFKANNLWRTSEEFSTEKKKGVKPLSAILSKHIDDPYQKFIYVYDEDGGNWTMRIEVIKLTPADSALSYPHLVKSNGVSPKQYVDPKTLMDDPSAKLFKEADGLIKDLGQLLALDEEADEEADDDKEKEKEKGDFNLYGEEIDESEV